MKVNLDTSLKPNRYGWIPDWLPWKKSLPFFFNRRGLLIHRVKAVHAHFKNGTYSHSSVEYWCSNRGQEKYGQFFDQPPTDRLVCAVCEAKAVAHGKSSSSELAGRHVCIGRVKVERLCCKQIQN